MNLLEQSFILPRGTAVITHHRTGVKLKAVGLFHAALPGGRQRWVREHKQEEWEVGI